MKPDDLTPIMEVQKKATRGPWVVYEGPSEREVVCAAPGHWRYLDAVASVPQKSDADYFACSRLLPIKELRELWRAAIGIHHHAADCLYVTTAEGGCSCGYHALRSAIRALEAYGGNPCR